MAADSEVDKVFNPNKTTPKKPLSLKGLKAQRDRESFMAWEEAGLGICVPRTESGCSYSQGRATRTSWNSDRRVRVLWASGVETHISQCSALEVAQLPIGDISMDVCGGWELITLTSAVGLAGFQDWED